MTDKVYVTTTGVSRWAVLDGLWAAMCWGYVPDRVHLFITRGREKDGEVLAHGRIDPWAVSDLLYDLTVTFGALSLENAGLTLLGEWGGKTSADYSKERVKVLFEDDDARGEVERQLGLCRAVLG